MRVHPEPANVPLFGNRDFAEVITKVRVEILLSHGGPCSPLSPEVNKRQRREESTPLLPASLPVLEQLTSSPGLLRFQPFWASSVPWATVGLLRPHDCVSPGLAIIHLCYLAQRTLANGQAWPRFKKTFGSAFSATLPPG